MLTGREKANFSLALSLIFVLCLLLTALPGFAGTGDGSGGGADEPLRLLSSYPANGQKDVPVDVQVKLGFSKNVINMSVKDNNQKCISLYSGSGALVPAKVMMADDQIEPEKKREIILAPVQALQPGSTYVVKIAPELQSKSGVTLGKQVTITFTTARTAKSSSTKTEQPSVSNAVASNNGQSSADNVKTNSQTPGDKTGQSNSGQQANSTAAVRGDSSPAVSNQPDGSGNAVSAGDQANSQDSQTTPAKEKTSAGGAWTKAVIATVLVLAAAAGYAYVKRKR